MRTAITILTLLAGQIAFAQMQKSKTQNSNNFYFYYGIFGMGSNMGHLLPTLRIHNNIFVYTKEQNQPEGLSTKKPEFVCEGTIPQSSIDSINAIVLSLKESNIYRANHCVMSGVVYYLTVANGTDTTKFTLHNTFDMTALKIINILNPYLPKDQKLYGSEKEIKEEEDCLTYLKEEIKKRSSDKKNE